MLSFSSSPSSSSSKPDYPLLSDFNLFYPSSLSLFKLLSLSSLISSLSLAFSPTRFFFTSAIKLVVLFSFSPYPFVGVTTLLFFANELFYPKLVFFASALFPIKLLFLFSTFYPILLFVVAVSAIFLLF